MTNAKIRIRDWMKAIDRAETWALKGYSVTLKIDKKTGFTIVTRKGANT